MLKPMTGAVTTTLGLALTSETRLKLLFGKHSSLFLHSMNDGKKVFDDFCFRRQPGTREKTKGKMVIGNKSLFYKL